MRKLFLFKLDVPGEWFYFIDGEAHIQRSDPMKIVDSCVGTRTEVFIRTFSGLNQITGEDIMHDPLIFESNPFTEAWTQARALLIAEMQDCMKDTRISVKYKRIYFIDKFGERFISYEREQQSVEILRNFAVLSGMKIPLLPIEIWSALAKIYRLKWKENPAAVNLILMTWVMGGALRIYSDDLSSMAEVILNHAGIETTVNYVGEYPEVRLF